MRFRVRYRRAAVSSPGNFDGDADFEILPRPVHGDSRRPEGVCERKASPVAKRKAGDLRRLPQLAHENRALLVQNACVEVEQCNQLIDFVVAKPPIRSEEHTSELQSLMRISYAVFCLKKKTNTTITT